MIIIVIETVLLLFLLSI